jgi:hypothetical protein
MSLLFPGSRPPLDAVDASWMHQPIIYLAVAAVCLVIALRFLRQALAPIGALIHAVAAAAVVVFTAAFALTMLVAAVFTMVR